MTSSLQRNGTSLLQRNGCEGLILFVWLDGFPLCIQYFCLYGSETYAAYMPFLILTLNPDSFVRWRYRLKVMFCLTSVEEVLLRWSVLLKSTQRLSYQRGSRNGMEKEMTKVKQLCTVIWFVRWLATSPQIWSSLQMAQATCFRKNKNKETGFSHGARKVAWLALKFWRYSCPSKSSLQALIPFCRSTCVMKCSWCGNSCGHRITYPSTSLALPETVLLQKV